MLSILIPTYNYNVCNLVFEINNQALSNNIKFEIIVLDDASNTFLEENNKINDIKNCSYKILEENIGRSKIRNLLSKKANFNWLLFLDADVIPKSSNFIKNYIKYIDNEIKIVNGGIEYQKEKPDKSKIFRWLYGIKRESVNFTKRAQKPYLRFLTLNFLIHKSIFETVKFNEELPNLRHEDTVFSYDLMQRNIKIVHIDNPIIHLGIDDFEIAIKKEQQSVIALKNLIDKKLISKDYVSISKLYFKIRKFKLLFIFKLLFSLFEKIILKNLSSKNPSLLLFDLYRISYLCTLK